MYVRILLHVANILLIHLKQKTIISYSLSNLYILPNAEYGATPSSWNVPIAPKLTVSLCVQRFFSLFFYGCSFLFLSQICHTYQFLRKRMIFYHLDYYYNIPSFFIKIRFFAISFLHCKERNNS